MKWLALIALVACKRDAAPDVAAGSSAAAGSNVKPIIVVTKDRITYDGAPACQLDGNYRLRFHSNGTGGWWLRLELRGNSARLTAKDVMSVLPDGPLALETSGCGATIRGKTEHSGDVTIAFTLDPATNLVTGMLSRSKGGEPNNAADTVPIAGRRDVGAPNAPACIHAGIYELAVGKTKWKLDQGTPRAGTCADFSDLANATVRVEPFGDGLVIDEVQGDTHEQSFARGKVTKHGDCEYELALAIQDFSFSGTITFAGDNLTGTATTARYQFFEDGEAGENLWACKASKAPLVGKRIAD